MFFVHFYRVNSECWCNKLSLILYNPSGHCPPIIIRFFFYCKFYPFVCHIHLCAEVLNVFFFKSFDRAILSLLMFFSKSTSILWAPSAKYFHPLLNTVYYTNLDGQWTLSSRSLSCKVDKISMLLQYEVESDVLKETQRLDVLKGQ